MSEIQALATKVEQLSASADFWNKAMLWCLAAAALIAVLIVITTRLAIVKTGEAAAAQSELDRAKDRLLTFDLKDKDEKIAGLEKDTAQQQERAAKAERSLVELRESLKDRSISFEQRTKLVPLLRRGPKGPVKIIWTPTDTDSLSLANEIKDVFAESGWEDITIAQAMGTDAVGITLDVRDVKSPPVWAVTIQNSFKAVGIVMDGFSRPTLPPNEIRIGIGHKPKIKAQ